MDDYRFAAGSSTFNGRSTRCRPVDHHEISRTKDVAEVVETRVFHALWPGDEQPNLVTPQTSRFGRFCGGQPARQIEGRHRSISQEGAHGRLSTDKGRRSLSRYLPLGGRSSTRRSNDGTTASGSARSEMSSSGKACCCILVRMSPGSKE